MKTHKIKTAGYDSYLESNDGSFTTYCGITENCSEDLKEKRLVGQHDYCTCKVCEIAYKKENREEIRKLHILNMADTVVESEWSNKRNGSTIEETLPKPTSRNMKLYMEKINEIIDVVNELKNNK